MLALLSVWWLATMHCRIEAVTELPWLACEESAEAEHGSCALDECATVEEGPYRQASKTADVVPPSSCEDAFATFALLPGRMRESPAGVDRPAASPADELPRWQFARRAAPIARAPSQNA